LLLLKHKKKTSEEMFAERNASGALSLLFDIRVSVHRYYDFLITTNKMQLFLIIYF